jgi:S-formylglutathione hydrolase FrmB
MMDAGMPPDAMVMAWRMEGDPHVTWDPAAVAAREHHDVIQTPNHFAYFDHLTGEGDRGRLSIYRELIPLDKVYSYEPVPAGLSPDEIRHIIGGEGTLWTEFMEKPSDVEQMMFPRTLALAEVLWSKRENKNLDDFHKRLARELPILNKDRVNDRESQATQSFRPDFPLTKKPVATHPVVPTHQVLNAPSLGNRTLPFRILLPADYETSNRRYAVLYLLHGLTGNENDWWDRTSLAEYAAKYHLVIVTPGTGDSWYANSAGANARYEDVIIRDLIPYIDAHYRTITAREGRAIAGNSMGGLGAVKFALRYPQLFAFAGSMSGTFDVPLTAHLGKTPSAKLLQDLQRIFGDQNNPVRRENNVFLLLNQAVRARTVLPYLYVSSGKSDPYPQVTESNPRFARILSETVPRSEYNERPGKHDWTFWDSEIYLMLGRMCVFIKTICS